MGKICPKGIFCPRIFNELGIHLRCKRWYKNIRFLNTCFINMLLYHILLILKYLFVPISKNWTKHFGQILPNIFWANFAQLLGKFCPTIGQILPKLELWLYDSNLGKTRPKSKDLRTVHFMHTVLKYCSFILLYSNDSTNE